MKRMILAGVSAISLLTLLAACGEKTQPGAPRRHRPILTLFVNRRVGLNGQKAALDGDVNVLRLNDGQTGGRGELVASTDDVQRNGPVSLLIAV